MVCPFGNYERFTKGRLIKHARSFQTPGVPPAKLEDLVGITDGPTDRAEAAALRQIRQAHLYRLRTRWLQYRAAFRARFSGGSHRPGWAPAPGQNTFSAAENATVDIEIRLANL